MIYIVMGVTGSGKTTVAELLAAKLGWAFLEADQFHSPANKAKMHQGIPLTDEDRIAVACRYSCGIAKERLQRERMPSWLARLLKMSTAKSFPPD